MTGLSGCGKSTIANSLDRLLYDAGAATMLLDGDNVRHGLCAPPELLAGEHGPEFAARFGLGFGPEDREENIRRISSVAGLIASAGLIVITAFVSPYRADRNRARRIIESAGNTGDFIEVFIDTPLEVCEGRDPKGLYKKARTGEIKFFTGITDPYESPEAPEIHLKYDSGKTPAGQAAEVFASLVQRGVILDRKL
jgi:adenylylsulfate kinase